MTAISLLFPSSPVVQLWLFLLDVAGTIVAIILGLYEPVSPLPNTSNPKDLRVVCSWTFHGEKIEPCHKRSPAKEVWQNKWRKKVTEASRKVTKRVPKMKKSDRTPLADLLFRHPEFFEPKFELCLFYQKKTSEQTEPTKKSEIHELVVSALFWFGLPGRLLKSHIVGVSLRVTQK